METITDIIHDLDTWDADDYMELFYSMSKGTQANIRADARAHGMATLPYLRRELPGVIYQQINFNARKAVAA